MSSPAVLSELDFKKVRRLIYRRAGINLGDSKRAMVFNRLSKRLNHLQINSFPEYLEQLNDPASPEWQFFTNALTTNLTSFFRENHHFDQLAKILCQHPPKQSFRIWCAAASTGEEPYSIAMVLLEAGNSAPGRVEILASDLDTQVLEYARRGVYPLEAVEKLGHQRMAQFFMKGTGSNSGYCQVRPELQRAIKFQQINLMDKCWALGDTFDIIFCRNVMIYFDKDTQHRLIQHFVRYMHQDSLFLAGHSENFHHCADLLKSVGRTIYSRSEP